MPLGTRNVTSVSLAWPRRCVRPTTCVLVRQHPTFGLMYPAMHGFSAAAFSHTGDRISEFRAKFCCLSLLGVIYLSDS